MRVVDGLRGQRNEEELSAKASGLASVFLSGRKSNQYSHTCVPINTPIGQAALEKHSQGPDAEPYKEFFDTKLAMNRAHENMSGYA